MYSKAWPRKARENATKHIDATDKDAEEKTITGLLKTRRKTYKQPAQDGDSLGEEPVHGPSGKNTGLLKEEGKHFQFKAKPPSKDSKASAKEPEPQTGKKKKRRPRKDGKNPTKQPDTSTTDSEEERQPKPFRRRKKEKGNK